MDLTIELALAFLGSGIGASLVTEAMSFINKKLIDSPLDGGGALIISGAIAFLLAAVQVAVAGIPTPQTWADILAITTTVWLTSQAFFHVILKRIDTLHVTPDIPLR